MRAVILGMLVLMGCGRSGLFDDAVPVPQPRPAQSQPSALLGHWASFQLGNCINDESWLSFEGESTLTVTSIDRNFCGPHSVVAAQGTFVESAQTIALEWTAAAGQRQLTTSFALLPLRGGGYVPEALYRLGDRELATGVWHPGPGGFSRVFVEHFTEDGQTYQRGTAAQVSFSEPLPAEGDCTAHLAWQAETRWGDDPVRRLDESFELPCRVTVEGGARRVRAVLLDTYGAFWKLMKARGLDTSYGWDLDRLMYGFGPDWVLGSDGNLYQRSSGYALSYVELLSPPPLQP